VVAGLEKRSAREACAAKLSFKVRKIPFFKKEAQNEIYTPLHNDVMLFGGSDATIIPIGLGGFVACRAFSERNDDPTRASRLWDEV
ncbi:hypothetical protein KI387_037267, partial [Taxus chinensis]